MPLLPARQGLNLQRSHGTVRSGCDKIRILRIHFLALIENVIVLSPPLLDSLSLAAAVSVRV